MKAYCEKMEDNGFEIIPIDPKDALAEVYRRGIETVVDWVHKNGTVSRSRKLLKTPYLDWQAKLKEWGIKQ